MGVDGGRKEVNNGRCEGFSTRPRSTLTAVESPEVEHIDERTVSHGARTMEQ